ncbi:LOW QUALITY PROTEIN: probable tRNA (uracil-O(2)-)-methyltransferase [Macrobrachium nipponense]|uniref:LOW QUALITY PROTEIN: probable tRNA (uracil-O(2)-)-methyltransferase n=1 Tax=Macrobrachium nipponense TaxID=159736 RepID=UPI0030C8A017
MEIAIEESPFSGNREHFWGAVQIYTEKSHILNRKICGSSNIAIGFCSEDFYNDNITSEFVDRLSQDVKSYERPLETGANNIQSNSQALFSNDHQELQQIECLRRLLKREATFHQTNTKNCSLQTQAADNLDKDEPCSESDVTLVRNGTSIPWQELSSHKKIAVAVIRKIHPKQLQKFAPQLEVVLLDGWKTSASYITRLVAQATTALPRINYSFQLSNSGILLTAVVGEGCEVKSSDSNVLWLKNNVLPKIVKWATEVEDDGMKPERGSLTLMNVQEYNELYQNLKVKYGQPLVENWPENTDPQKFVFEDVAIATYLILLWRKEREVKGITDYQTFVDLGCGNGLLVYILSGEGHKGLGIDLKKRSIWDTFPERVVLQEGVVEPSCKNLFPDYDWLIGNHSDELTPWLPVIAAKSKYTTRFFVIPCCAHDFDCKYKRQHAGISQYADYIQYIKEVGLVCGFHMSQDKLRIPSTKRVCLIGQERTYSFDDSPRVMRGIDEFIQNRNEFNAKAAAFENGTRFVNNVDESGKRTADSLWSTNFKAREAVQPVRNCTRLKDDVKHDLLATIVDILLEKKHLVEVDVGCQKSVYWDKGRSINLGDLAKRIGPERLLSLKKECGGLQTLLRNHRHMFSILQGEVSLQIPVTEWKASVPKDRIKTKQCWFHHNHYQNCPLPSSACIYAHGEDDIRTNL